MRTALARIALAALLTAATGSAQFSNASLKGKYHFVQLMAAGSSGQSQEMRNTWGAITFDGAGLYTWTGKSAAGAAAPGAASGVGDYTVSPAGVIWLNSFSIQAGFSADGRVLLGATTDATDNTQSLWVALRAPVWASSLSGTYSGGSLAFQTGATKASITTYVTLVANGGTFTPVSAIGHSSARSEKNVKQEADGALYEVNADGTGMAWFGLATPLFTGDHDIYVSEGGEHLLGVSRSAALRDLIFATKRLASPQAFGGAYWVADLSLETGTFASGWGKLVTTAGVRVLMSQRVRLGLRSIDYSGVNYHCINPDNTGCFFSQPGPAVTNLALGPGGAVAAAAQIGAIDTIASQHGIAVMAKAPEYTDIMNPVAGLVSAAAFPPFPGPISPGQIQSLFGTGLASETASAGSLPLPTDRVGVRVRVNGTPAPLFLVSPGQINFQTPFGLTGRTATIRVENNGAVREAVAPLAPTNPGVFTYDAVGDSQVRGVVLHPDGTVVTTANPAYPGETVVVYLTGLGELTPSVATGAANPSLPLAWMREPRLSVLFGGEPSANIWFAGGTPTTAGLNQVNVEIPYSTPESDFTPVSVATPNAFTDVAEIAVRRRR